MFVELLQCARTCGRYQGCRDKGHCPSPQKCRGQRGRQRSASLVETQWGHCWESRNRVQVTPRQDAAPFSGKAVVAPRLLIIVFTIVTLLSEKNIPCRWVNFPDNKASLSRSRNLKHLKIIFDGNICQMYSLHLSFLKWNILNKMQSLLVTSGTCTDISLCV